MSQARLTNALRLEICQHKTKKMKTSVSVLAIYFQQVNWAFSKFGDHLARSVSHLSYTKVAHRSGIYYRYRTIRQTPSHSSESEDKESFVNMVRLMPDTI